MKPKVMIIDDDAFIVEFIKSAFEKKGVEVITCVNPVQAQAMAEACLPDLIIIDVYMEPLNGVTVATQLKRWHVTADIPMIFISSDLNKDTAKQAFLVGAMDVMPKPIDPKPLLERAQPLIDFRKVHKLIKEVLHKIQIIIFSA